MKKRVAAYIRVSTGRKAQEHSFDFQKDYWTKKLSEDPTVELVGIYADKAISGKEASRRPEFMAMIQACHEGRIDMIYTKSVQRFARNTTELLTTTRELRERGIGVFFEKENINTLDTTSELYLTIAAAIAEEDLNTYSSNVKWSYLDKFKKGEVTLVVEMFGLELDNEHRIVGINEEEAKWVRKAFELYIEEGWGSDKIAKYFNEQGVPTKRGGTWKSSGIRQMLLNEKYCGDAYLQKSYGVGRQRRKNRGEVDMYYVKDNHPAIVSRETWEKAKEIMKSRSTFNPKNIGNGSPIYPYTSKIRCACCGSTAIHKWSQTTYGRIEYWKCRKSIEERKVYCDNPGIKASVLDEKFIDAFNEFVETKQLSVEVEPYNEKLEQLIKEEQEIYLLNLNGLISDEDFMKESGELKTQMKFYEKKIQDLSMIHINAKDLRKIDKFDENLVHRFVKSISLENWTVKFEFYNGVVIERQYTNGAVGVKKGGKQ